MSPNVLAAVAAPAASQTRLASGLLGDSGSKEALSRLNAAMEDLKQATVRAMLEESLAALRKEDQRRASEYAIKALEYDERNGLGWYLLGIACERSGDFASSIRAFESALKLLPDHAEIANNLGRLAMRMGMKSQAEKFFRHYAARFPGNVEAANNMAVAIRDQNRHEEAIEILREAILANPEQPMLWSTMGTVVAEQGDYTTARVFFEESVRLNPNYPKARYNLGNSQLALGDAAAALESCDTAMRGVISEDERQMMRMARSSILIALGRIKDGWEEYECRLHPQFAELTRFLIDRPLWEPGADLAGKSFLVVGEQGLGDEVLFSNILPDVLERLGPDGKLVLAVEARLVDLFARSFPQATVTSHATYKYLERPARAVPLLEQGVEVDLWAPIASLLREFRPTVASFPDRFGFLEADPERVAYWRDQLRSAPPGAKIGLLWKSGIFTTARRRFFSAFEQWAPVLKQPGVTFVNLQYGDCSQELGYAREQLGVDIWTPPGIDLKQDLDDVTALCAAMDLTIGFSNATFNLAAAIGSPAWLITSPGAWPRLGTRDQYPWYPQVRVFAPETYADWEPTMVQVAEALAAFTAERRDSPGV
ncbi:tetratricopeptide repeat protein [Phenylobacterium deserti]|uniref:tetratricopeptide repeat protein n=1 Tax=Phenylobacterium deserti TaxID=1914756 RepID=UPI001F0CD056|nr:tetratricopeptide repeat protein [Phenylobacterium deserti]